MTETVAQLIPILEFLAGPGAGVIASFLIDWLRRTNPAQGDGNTAMPLWLSIMNSPFYTRYASFFLATAIALIFTAALAALQGQDIYNALDLVLASSLAIVFSQITHSRHLAR